MQAEQTQVELPPITEPEPRSSRRHTVGQLLRQTRESQGSDLNRVATALRIRAAYLEAIEEGRFDNLPGAVYALGFVRTYAVHLGLDGEEAVRRFKLEAEGFEGQRDLTFPVPLGERSIPGATLVLAAVILAICGYGLFYYLSSSARPRPERVAAVPVELEPPRAAVTTAVPPLGSEAAPSGGAAAVAPQSAVATAPVPSAVPVPPPAEAPATVSPMSAPSVVAPTAPEPAPAATAAAPPALPAPVSAAPPAPTETAALPPLPAESTPAPKPERSHVYGIANGGRIVIHATADSWIQVRDKDNVAIFTRQLHAGDTYHVPDQPGLSLRTGAASALAITVDGRHAPALSGAVHGNVLLDPDRLLSGTAIQRSPTRAAPADAPAPTSVPAPAAEPPVEPTPAQAE